MDEPRVLLLTSEEVSALLGAALDRDDLERFDEIAGFFLCANDDREDA